MYFLGWASLAGGEIWNVERTLTYLRANAPGLDISGCDECPTLATALGDPPYKNNPVDDDAPWIADDEPDLADFYGFYPMGMAGLYDGTISVNVTESTGDGGFMSSPRHATKEMRVHGLLMARTRIALVKGRAWLAASLAGSGCAGSLGCHGDSMCFFADCPQDAVQGDYYLRTLRDVGLTEGPAIIKTYGQLNSGIWMDEIDFTLTAATPWIYGPVQHLGSTMGTEETTGSANTLTLVGENQGPMGARDNVVALPVDTEVGDLLVLQWGSDFERIEPLPAGWVTEVVDHTNSYSGEVAWKIATANDTQISAQPGYDDLVFADGAINYWRLSEQGGTSAVDTAGGHTGSFQAPFSLDASPLGFGLGPATDLTGGMVSIPAPAGPLNAPWTVEVWFGLPATAVGSCTLLSTRLPGDLFEIFAVSDGAKFSKLTFALGTGTLRDESADPLWLVGETQVPVNIPFGSANHVAFVAGPSTYTLYLNGVSIASGAIPGTAVFWNAANGMRVANSPFQGPGIGRFSNVALYPTMLTPTQVANHWTRGRTSPTGTVTITVDGAGGGNWTCSAFKAGTYQPEAPLRVIEHVAQGATYDSTVAGDGAISYWKMDEASGLAVADSVGYVPLSFPSAPGVLRGQPAIAPGLGPSLSVDVTTPSRGGLTGSVPTMLTPPFTWEGWLAPTALGYNFGGIMSNWPGVFQVGLDHQFTPNFYGAWAVTSNQLAKPGTDPTKDPAPDPLSTAVSGLFPSPITVPGTPMYLAIVVDATTMSVYHNGLLIGSGPHGDIDPKFWGPGYNPRFMLGQAEGGQIWGGRASNWAVYNKTLTAAQIANHWTMGTTAPGRAGTDTGILPKTMTSFTTSPGAFAYYFASRSVVANETLACSAGIPRWAVSRTTNGSFTNNAALNTEYVNSSVYREPVWSASPSGLATKNGAFYSTLEVLPVGGPTLSLDETPPQLQDCSYAPPSIIYDPTVPQPPQPPRPPPITNGLEPPQPWMSGYSIFIPGEYVPEVLDAVLIITLTTGAEAARWVRLRLYASPLGFDQKVTDLDPCSFCGEIVVTYIPPNSKFVIDGMTQTVSIIDTAGNVYPASHLAFSSAGAPVQWPSVTCAMDYWLSVEYPGDADPYNLFLTPAGSTVIDSSTFTVNLGSWTNGINDGSPRASLVRDTAQSHVAPASMRVNWPLGSKDRPQVVLPGLVVGTTYELGMWVKSPAVRVRLDLGDFGIQASPDPNWVHVTGILTATASTMTAVLSRDTTAASGNVYVDEFSLRDVTSAQFSVVEVAITTARRE